MESKRVNSASVSRPGAPKKLSEEGRDRVRETSRLNPDIKRQDLLKEVDHKVKASSIWRLKHEMGARK